MAMSEGEILDTSLANKPCLEIKAIIVRRRSMGKNLAFSHVKVMEGMKMKGDIDTGKDENIIQVVFRRQSNAWDSSKDETFPTKNSQLPYGAVIKLQLYQSHNESNQQGASAITHNTPKYEVHRWSILVDPRIEAVDHAKTVHPADDADGIQHEGVSCSKYFTSRMNQYLKYNGESNSNHAKLSKQSKDTKTIEQTQDSSSHGDKKHKGLRAKIFASFLIDRFGPEFFQKGHVLDIAGGKGQLSLELSLQSQSQCTIIDPLIRGKKDTQQFHSRDIKRIQRAKGVVPNHVAKCFVLNDECLDLVRKSTCIVGLHPDECTEDILDAAIELNKPAAIIPCCVFASLFPDRKLKNGATVCSYDQFLEYLMGKDERIQRFSLPFEGKNEVLVFYPF